MRWLSCVHAASHKRDNYCCHILQTMQIDRIFTCTSDKNVMAGRSVLENSTRNTSTMGVKMLARATAQKGAGQVVRASIPYIRSDVPIFIIFRALGFVSDRDILEHIVYSFEDNEMMEALRPSIEESQPIQSQEVSLVLCLVSHNICVVLFAASADWLYCNCLGMHTALLLPFVRPLFCTALMLCTHAAQEVDMVISADLALFDVCLFLSLNRLVQLNAGVAGGS